MTPARRNMPLVALNAFTFFFGFGLFGLLPLYLEEHGMAPGQIGIIFSLVYLSSMLGRPLLGGLISRLGMRAFAVSASLLGLLIAISFLFLTPETVWLVYPLRILQGLAVASIDLVASVTPYEMSPKGRHARSLGVINVCAVAGWTASPAAAEFLLRVSGFPAIFLAATIFSLIAVVAALAFRLPAPLQRRPRRVAAGLSGPWRATINRNLILVFAVTFLTLGLAGGSLTAFIPLYASHRGLGAGSAFFLASSVTAVLSGLFLSGLSDRFGRRQVIIPMLMLGIGAQALLFDLRSAVALVFVGVVYGLTNGIQSPALMALTAETTPEGTDTALPMALFFTALDAGLWLGPSFFGFLSEVLDFGPAYLSLTICLLMGIFLIARVRPSPRIIPAEPAVAGRESLP